MAKKSKPMLVTLTKKGDEDATGTKDEDENAETDITADDPQEAPQQAAGLGATKAANELASTQLDSDDEDFVEMRKGLKKTNAHDTSKHTASIRRERKRLYELQESKRRLRQEEGRSKSNNDEGETPLLQKCKRLKIERKAVWKEYTTYNKTIVSGGGGQGSGSMKKNKNRKRKQKASHGITLPKP